MHAIVNDDHFLIGAEIYDKILADSRIFLFHNSTKTLP